LQALWTLDEPRRSIEEGGGRIDAGRLKEAGQRRVRNQGLTADHRQAHVAAGSGNESVERTGGIRPEHCQIGARTGLDAAPILQPEQLRRAGADRARQPFGAQLVRCMSRPEFVEQIALAAQSRITPERKPVRIVESTDVRGGIEEELIR